MLLLGAVMLPMLLPERGMGPPSGQVGRRLLLKLLHMPLDRLLTPLGEVLQLVRDAGLERAER